MSKKYRVLHDLWVSFVGGYAGIPQDTRLIFNILSQSESLQVDGFFYPKKKRLSLRSQTEADAYFEKLLQSEDFLQESLEDLPNKTVRVNPLKKIKLLFNLIVTNSILKKKYDLYPINADYKDMLWRNVFSKTLGAEDKKNVLKNAFYYSDISWRDMMYAGYYDSKVYLNTQGYDFALFPDVRPVTVSPGTKKIIRYHDSFGFLCPDFFQTYHAMMHLNSLKACKQDSYFVCNSEPTRDTLVEIFPEVADKAFVVAPVVRPYPKMKSWDALKQVCMTRVSNRIVKNPDLNAMLQEAAQFDYILALSTLEPRKNYINLIRAWENLFYQHNHRIKLMIVANPGWLSEEIEAAMRPHIELGNIIHLSNISSDEMPYLFSHAKLFATLSYTEGFGSPPVEAMQCECPVLASDNATHRWSMGDAALYVNPYDVNSITNGMVKLTCDKEAELLRTILVKKGLERVKLYSQENIQAQWLELFNQLK